MNPKEIARLITEDPDVFVEMMPYRGPYQAGARWRKESSRRRKAEKEKSVSKPTKTPELEDEPRGEKIKEMELSPGLYYTVHRDGDDFIAYLVRDGDYAPGTVFKNMKEVRRDYGLTRAQFGL